MYINNDAKYIRIPKSSNSISSRLFIYIEGVLEKVFFITPGNNNGYTYYPLYKKSNKPIIIEASDEGLLDELAIIVWWRKYAF